MPEKIYNIKKMLEETEPAKEQLREKDPPLDSFSFPSRISRTSSSGFHVHIDKGVVNVMGLKEKHKQATEKGDFLRCWCSLSLGGKK